MTKNVSIVRIMFLNALESPSETSFIELNISVSGFVGVGSVASGYSAGDLAFCLSASESMILSFPIMRLILYQALKNEQRKN